MSETKIQAEARSEFGKGAARRIRRDKKVPAVLYGHGMDPLHVTLPAQDAARALKQNNALLEIAIGKETHLAIPKQIQRDVLKGTIDHVDLLVVRKGEKVNVEINLHIVGEPSRDALVVTELSHVQVEAEATHIPESIEVSLEGRQVGDQIHAGDLVLPKGLNLVTDPEILLINLVGAPTANQVQAELDEAQAEAAAAPAAAAEPAAEAQENSDSE